MFPELDGVLCVVTHDVGGGPGTVTSREEGDECQSLESSQTPCISPFGWLLFVAF